MNRSYHRSVVLAAAVAGVVNLGQYAAAAPQLITTSTYTQNFDHSTWSKNGSSTSFGVGWGLLETGTGSNTAYVDGDGSAAVANTYVFHTGSGNDLAFGTLRDATNFASTIGANFQNNVGVGSMSTIVALNLGYTGEQWRRGGTGTDRLDFQISTNATSLSTGTWTDHNALDFNSVQNSGAAAALDGNAAANRTAINSTITGLNILSTGHFWIRWNDFDSTVEHGLGIDDFSLQALTVGYDSQITSSGSVAFGRVMQGSTTSNNSSATLNKSGTQNTEYSATANNNGISVTAPGVFGTGAGSHNLTVALANNANGTASTGAKNFTVTVDNQSLTSGGSGQGSADTNDTVNVSATVVQNRVVTGSTVALGRRMVGATIGGTSNLSTTLDNNNATAVTVATTGGPNGDGISVTGGSGTAFNSAGSTGTRSLGGSFGSSGMKSGTVILTTTGEGLAGEAPINVNVGYTATALNDRVITTSNVNFGTMLVGTNVGDSSTLTSSGSDNDNTRVTVATTAGADANGVSVTGGTTTLFNGSSGGSRNLSGNFGSAGSYSSSIGLTTTGEGLAGESVNNVSIAYTATALDHSNASFSGSSDDNTLNINFGTVFQNSSQSQGFNLYNLIATAGFTAKLDLDSISGSGDTSTFTNDLAAFSNLIAGGDNAYTQQFDTTSLGTFSAVYTLNLSDEDLPGANTQVLMLNVSGNVVPVPEPTIIGMVSLIGAAGLLRRRR